MSDVEGRKDEKMKVLINGFGRIGRAITRINLTQKVFELVAVNDINPDNKNIAYLLKYDSTFGRLKNSISSDDGNLYIDECAIKLYHKETVQELDLEDIDILIDSSGIKENILQIEEIAKTSSSKRFIITNIDSKKSTDIIFGVNHELLKNAEIKIISSSICDAISLGPVYHILTRAFEIESGFLTTLHPWLSYQNLLDGPAKSWSQPGDIYSHYALGRSAVASLIPKSTSAIRALNNVFPNVIDKICSFSYRTPTSLVSSAVLTLLVDRKTTVDEIIELFKTEESKQKYNIIKTTDEPLISMDYAQSSYSAILDTRWIQVNNGNHIELVYWYDNEWGYASRVVDIVGYVEKLEKINELRSCIGRF